jgi:N4-(beta-N-acetylglucosaminyl)-L-asparaginase
VQLDAAVMHGPSHQAGAVACIEGVKTPSRVAKIVMEQTDHVLLIGQGATHFARQHGFPEENLLTERARKIWLRWKQRLSDKDDWLEPPNDDQGSLSPEDAEIERLAMEIIRNRPTGTIHCGGMDADGNISCCTTTSGLAFKIPGRVGDSPIIGAGLYCDNEIGSCGSTGRGEANLQNQCSFAAVELMGRGMTPEEAGLEVLRRVAKHTVPRLQNDKGEPDFGLNFYLLRKDGMHAGVAMRGPAKCAVTDDNGTRHEPCATLF